MMEKSATSTRNLGLGKEVADEIEAMPIDATKLKPNRYPERVLSVSIKNRRRGARGKRAARRRLIGIVTVSSLRNLFQSTLVSIDPGSIMILSPIIFILLLLSSSFHDRYD